MEKKKDNLNFTFIDLFAGIGGFRIAFENSGGTCVFSSEWDKHSQVTYKENFGDLPYGDITKINEKDIPDHDILVGGFPCQPFSIAGISKKISLGRKHGFEDKKQGNLFFDIARILKEKNPKAFVLENVKHLKNHDKGQTYEVIKSALEDLGYIIFDKIIDAANYVPQHRERIFIVGFRKDIYSGKVFLFPTKESHPGNILKNILEKQCDSKYTLSDHLWNYLQNYAKKHKANGNGFGFGLVDPAKDKLTRTLSARYHKDGSEILIKQNRKNPRRLTPRECARLMGFPDSFKIPVSDTQAYREFGNAVAVPVVKAIAKEVIRYLKDTDGSNYKSTKKLEYVSYQKQEYRPRTACAPVSL